LDEPWWLLVNGYWLLGLNGRTYHFIISSNGTLGSASAPITLSFYHFIILSLHPFIKKVKLARVRKPGLFFQRWRTGFLLVGGWG